MDCDFSNLNPFDHNIYNQNNSMYYALNYLGPDNTINSKLISFNDEIHDRFELHE